MNQVSNKRFNFLKKTLIFFLMVALILPAFSDTAFAANIFIGDFSMDTTCIDYKHSCHINGSISSSNNLKTVEAIVYKKSTKKKVTSSKQTNINKPYYSLRSSKVDNDLKFANLSGGSYYLVVKATDSQGTTVSKSIDFTITNSNLKITGLDTAKGSITKGSGCSIIGKISSNYTITKVRAVIEQKGYEGNYKEVGKAYVYNPNKKSIVIKNSPIDKNLKFGKLASGKYRVKIEVWDKTGSRRERTSPDIYIHD